MQNIPWKQWNGWKVEKREKNGKAENVQKNLGKIMGSMTENYRGDNERKTQNENLEEAK